MSEAAIDAYRHASGMRDGETWTFLTVVPVRRFAVRIAEPLPTVEDVAQRYGAEAAALVGPDRVTVQVRLTAS